jgi:hypothetical protein
MPGQLSLFAEFAELRASARKTMSTLRQIHFDLRETIAKSRATIAESTTLIANLNKALPPE